MIKRILFSIVALALFSQMLLSCKSTHSPHEVLRLAKEKISNSPSIHYKLTIHSANSNIESQKPLFAEIIRSKVDESFHGFGFHGNAEGVEIVYDGFDMYQINHPIKTIIRFNRKNIEKEGFFDSNLIVSESPLAIFKQEKFDLNFDTLINKKAHIVFEEEQKQFFSGQKNDKSKAIKRFFIEKNSKIISQTQLIFINNNEDTSQIVTSVFSDYQFENTSYDFSKIDPRNVTDFENVPHARYQEISQEDYMKQQQMKQVKESEQLVKKSYEDIDAKNISLYGDSEKKTIIMFSFIGCGGCEFAMKEMRKRNYAFNKEINFYYSSPYNNSKVLKKYLEKKDFPYGAFSKESNMVKDFNIFSYPTFVLIDTNGKIEKVMSAFTKEVEEIIFENKN